MSNSEPNIKIPVDLTNPGQFFACCGLLELADKLWPGAMGGFFEGREFCILTADRSATLVKLLETASMLKTWVDLVLEDPLQEEGNNNQSEETEKEPPFKPFELRSDEARVSILLDWWSDHSLKPWAGRMKDRVILRAMLAAINPLNNHPFDELRTVSDPIKSLKPTPDGTKREPFYFDPRRGNKSHPLDSGFSPDTQKKKSDCCPALEALCFIGLQRARPAPTGIAYQSRYTVWTQCLQANLVGAVVCGIVPIPGSIHYVFSNYFRSDQRKYKTFSQAILERNNHV